MSGSVPVNVTITSTDLLLGLRDPNNSSIWQQYVDRYRPLLVKYARKMGLKDADAEDVAQLALVTFCRAYQDGKYDRERGRLRVWLFAIARNQILSFHRRPEREVQVGGDGERSDFFAAVGDENRMEQVWEEQWREAVVKHCLDEIRREVEPRTFEAFELFATHGLPADVVGQKLGITANAVFGAKRRILRRLRELLPAAEEAF